MPIDPYLDKETGILRNRLGAATNIELKELEPQIVFASELGEFSARVGQ